MRCRHCHGPAVRYSKRNGLKRVYCLFCGETYTEEPRHENHHEKAMELAPAGWAPIA